MFECFFDKKKDFFVFTPVCDLRVEVDSCYGIQSKTTFGDWNDCLLFYGNCDIEFNSKVGGQYTLLSRACFDKGLSSVNNDCNIQIIAIFSQIVHNYVKGKCVVP